MAEQVRGHCCGPLQRGGKVGADGVHYAAYADVLQGGGGQYRHYGPGLGPFGQAHDQLIFGQLFPFQVFHRQFIVDLGDGLGHRVPELVGLVCKVCRRILFLTIGAVGLHGDQIDHTLEAGLCADRCLDRDALPAESLPDGLEGLVKVGVFSVHLVKDDNSGEVSLLDLPPHELRAHLDTRGGAEHQDSGIGHLEGGHNLPHEIGVPGGVYQIDLSVVPFIGEKGDLDTGSTADLFRFVIGCGGAGVYLTQAVYVACVEQHRLGERSLAGAAVGKKHDVSYSIRLIAPHNTPTSPNVFSKS